MPPATSHSQALLSAAAKPLATAGTSSEELVRGVDKVNGADNNAAALVSGTIPADATNISGVSSDPWILLCKRCGHYIAAGDERNVEDASDTEIVLKAMRAHSVRQCEDAVVDADTTSFELFCTGANRSECGALIGRYCRHTGPTLAHLADRFILDTSAVTCEQMGANSTATAPYQQDTLSLRLAQTMQILMGFQSQQYAHNDAMVARMEQGAKETLVLKAKLSKVSKEHTQLRMRLEQLERAIAASAGQLPPHVLTPSAAAPLVPTSSVATSRAAANATVANGALAPPSRPTSATPRASSALPSTRNGATTKPARTTPAEATVPPTAITTPVQKRKLPSQSIQHATANAAADSTAANAAEGRVTRQRVTRGS